MLRIFAKFIPNEVIAKCTAYRSFRKYIAAEQSNENSTQSSDHQNRNFSYTVVSVYQISKSKHIFKKNISLLFSHNNDLIINVQ